MPNTTCLVQAGASVFVRGTKATNSDAQLIQSLFEAIGTCEEVTEGLMDPITALSGSGPAYVNLNKKFIHSSAIITFYRFRFLF